jgi:hypothetical protein
MRRRAVSSKPSNAASPSIETVVTSSGANGKSLPNRMRSGPTSSQSDRSANGLADSAVS